MVNYVEQAVLRVRDQASSEIRKVNTELRRLISDADRLNRSRSMRMNLEGVATAMREIRAMREELRRIQGTTARSIVHVDVRDAELNALRADLASVRSNTRLRVTVTTPTRSLTTLNSRLDALRAEAPVVLSVTAPGLQGLTAELREVSQLLDRIRGRSTTAVQLPTTRTGPGSQGQQPGSPASDLDDRTFYRWGSMVASGFRGGVGDGEWFGRRIAGGLAGAIGGELYDVGRRSAIATIITPLDREDAILSVRGAGIEGADLAAYERIAGRVSQSFPTIGETAILGAMREVAGRIEAPLASPEGEAQLLEAASRMAESAHAMQLINPGRDAAWAMEQSRQAEALISLAGAAGDPERARELQQVLIMGAQSSGGDLNWAEARRMAQQAQSLSIGVGPATLLSMAMDRDEGGRMSTAGFRDVFQDMTRGNLEQGDMAAQIAMGMRDAQGRSLVADMARDDIEGFFLDWVAPRMEAMGVSLDDETAVQNALDSAFGFVDQAGLALGTAVITQREQRRIERARARETNIGLLTNPNTRTTRMEFGAFGQQFDNLVSQTLLPVMQNVVSPAMDTMTSALQAAQATETPADDIAATLASAFPLALSAALMGMQDPSTRPLSLASIALLGASRALQATTLGLGRVAIGFGVVLGIAGLVEDFMNLWDGRGLEPATLSSDMLLEQNQQIRAAREEVARLQASGSVVPEELLILSQSTPARIDITQLVQPADLEGMGESIAEAQRQAEERRNNIRAGVPDTLLAAEQADARLAQLLNERQRVQNQIASDLHTYVETGDLVGRMDVRLLGEALNRLPQAIIDQIHFIPPPPRRPDDLLAQGLLRPERPERDAQKLTINAEKVDLASGSTEIGALSLTTEMIRAISVSPESYASFSDLPQYVQDAAMSDSDPDIVYNRILDALRNPPAEPEPDAPTFDIRAWLRDMRASVEAGGISAEALRQAAELQADMPSRLPEDAMEAVRLEMARRLQAVAAGQDPNAPPDSLVIDPSSLAGAEGMVDDMSRAIDGSVRGAGDTIAEGSERGASLLSLALDSAFATGAAALNTAISSALAQGTNVNVNQQGSRTTAPRLDTGRTGPE